jgi:hypothetical protein
MSTKTAFTEDEWTMLLRLPLLAGTAVVTADASGPIGLFKELSAMGKHVLAAGENAGSGGLVADLVADIKAIAEKKLPAPKDEKIAPRELKPRLLDHLRQATSLLSAKSTPLDTETYKQWILDVTTNVARAAKEGTLLGFGGTLVSEAERGLLREIADVLGLAAPAV